MTAGYGEEILFRLALLPALYLLLLRARATPNIAAASSVIATGLAFAVLHQVGSGASPPAYFATRFLFPGCVMSIVFLRVSPTFIVVAHCTAHLLMPVLFV
jgi:membrane protease YdiL (CAAX protease family)